jgi:uncharacterized membrane protein
MLVLFPSSFALAPAIPVPQRLQAFGLCAQSVATLFADVLFLSKDSFWHLLDRWIALSNVLFVASNMYWLSRIEKAVFILAVLGGVELLNARIVSTQPIVGWDWSSDKCGLAAAVCLDQTLRVFIVTRLAKL